MPKDLIMLENYKKEKLDLHLEMKRLNKEEDSLPPIRERNQSEECTRNNLKCLLYDNGHHTAQGYPVKTATLGYKTNVTMIEEIRRPLDFGDGDDQYL